MRSPECSELEQWCCESFYSQHSAPRAVGRRSRPSADSHRVQWLSGAYSAAVMGETIALQLRTDQIVARHSSQIRIPELISTIPGCLTHRCTTHQRAASTTRLTFIAYDGAQRHNQQCPWVRLLLSSRIRTRLSLESSSRSAALSRDE